MLINHGDTYFLCKCCVSKSDTIIAYFGNTNKIMHLVCYYNC
jgi:hypothetical protein